MLAFLKRSGLGILQFAFFPGLPVALWIWLCTSLNVDMVKTVLFIGVFSLCIVAIIVYSIVKIFKINPIIRDIEDENKKLQTDKKIETDREKLANIDTVIKNNNSNLVIIGAIRPAMFIVAGLVLCLAIEAQIVVFSGTLYTGAACYGVSKVIEAFKVRQMSAKRLKGEEKDE